MRVLIVEDDRAMSALLQQGLQEEYHVVSSALDGKTGLDLAKSYEFDVIVLDWMLPGIDGVEVMRRLRTVGNVSPVLMLTARDAILEMLSRHSIWVPMTILPSLSLLRNFWLD